MSGIKVRLSGTKIECSEMVKKIAQIGKIREESVFYPNRGDSLLGRVYLDVEIIHERGQDNEKADD